MFHCLSNAAEGGATTFTDGFAAAEVLRQQNAEAFRLLACHPHPFEYRDPTNGVLLRAEVPILTVDAGGRLERVCFNNRSAGVVDLPPDELEAYYQAYAAFENLCNAEEFSIAIKFRPGDMVIFLNSRVMHGRQEFTPGAGRHLQGCYIDHDVVRSLVDWSAIDDSADRTCVDVHASATDSLISALKTQEEFCYGEGVNMLQHALQAAHCARLQGEVPSAILCSLFHDVGNTKQARDNWVAMGHSAPELLVSPSDNSIGYQHHTEIGAAFLECMGFSQEVSSAVGLHVSAKRALVAADTSYMNELSQASIDTLAQQGGPLNAEELLAYKAMPGAEMALRLLRYDDLGKSKNLKSHSSNRIGSSFTITFARNRMACQIRL